MSAQTVDMAVDRRLGRKEWSLTCLVCGDEFTSANAATALCPTHKAEREEQVKDARRRGVPAPPARFTCPCGVVWESMKSLGRRCPSCAAERKKGQQKAWRQVPANVEKRRKSHQERRYARKWDLATKYGLTLEEYEQMCRERGNRCDICGKPSKSPCVDHDHDTGLVRGLLCRKCNRGLGLLGDSAAALARAVKYLGGVP